MVLASGLQTTRDRNGGNHVRNVAHMGCVTATYVPGLKKYVMCITDGWPTVAKMTSYILEADTITGPWRIVVYMKDFGEQAYFLNFPSKFVSDDRRTLWLCYSAKFSSGWNGMKLKFNPSGGRIYMPHLGGPTCRSHPPKGLQRIAGPGQQA